MRKVRLASAVFLALGVCVAIAQVPQVPPPMPAGEAIAPSADEPVLFQPGQIVGRVGDKTILYCDVSPTVSMILTPLLAKVKSQAERDAIESQRELLTKNVIQQVLQNKMLLMEFERGMPNEIRTDGKKRAEAQGKLDKQVRRAFDLTLADCREKMANATPEDTDKLLRQDPIIARLAMLMRDRKLESSGELDRALREFGTSLDRQVRDFGEYMMGIEAAKKEMGLDKKKFEVTHEEMLDYYAQHLPEYAIPAKARFEILTAKFANFAGDRAATYEFAAKMGNEVVLGGTPFAAVARKHSQEPRAAEGGQYDWVTPGSLASKPIDSAVFALEVGKLSQIIEDESGFHIVRVIERKDAGQVSFVEAQAEIRPAIEQEKRDAKRQKYLSDLRARTKTWTIYDPPAEQAALPATTTPR
jgi:hypothetical protein